MTVYGAASRQPLKVNGKTVDYGTTRRLKNGTLVYEFTPPRRPGQKYQGPQVMKGITTATDAKLEIERLVPISRQGGIGDRTMQLGFAFDACLAAMRSGEFKHSEGTYSERSIELFVQRAEDHVLPALDRSTKVVDIKVAHLRSLMRRLENEGFGGSTVRGVISCAGTILRYAVEQEVIEANPANSIGRGERPSAKRRSEPRYLSIPEVEQLLDKVTDPTTKAVVASLFWGALRVSEALELRWSDVGTDTLLVRGTKTKGSYGQVPLLPQLAEILKAHRERMGKLGFDRIQPDSLVFQTRNGTPLGRRNVLRSVQVASEEAGLNREGVAPVGCHDLRHSMAACALGFGLSLIETSKLLRHANPQVTATIYAGLTDTGVEALGAKLQAGFGG